MTREELFERYHAVRRQTEKLCEPLAIEDYVIQSVVDASPPKWALAHVTWFFETFALGEFLTRYERFNRDYAYLFNSYYVQAGPRHRRDLRGMIGRPTVHEIMTYRREIDARIGDLIGAISEERYPAMHEVVLLGLQHEQQHQELLLTDIKHNLFMNPMLPVYRGDLASPAVCDAVDVDAWVSVAGGLVEVGAEGDGFAFDNERPRHKTYLQPFALREQLVTNGEYLAFMEDDGYAMQPVWLADGWDAAQAHAWEAPLYWIKQNHHWRVFTLGGVKELNANEPVTHISHYEANAFAAWAGARLATEFEWEHAATTCGCDAKTGNLVEDDVLHPVASCEVDRGLQQILGNVWEWTASAHLGYPGYHAQRGALGEYNGKFMANQMVLRGGSCVTPRDHIRTTYRNFFHPEMRLQFTGIRLAKDAR